MALDDLENPRWASNQGTYNEHGVRIGQFGGDIYRRTQIQAPRAYTVPGRPRTVGTMVGRTMPQAVATLNRAAVTQATTAGATVAPKVPVFASHQPTSTTVAAPVKGPLSAIPQLTPASERRVFGPGATAADLAAFNQRIDTANGVGGPTGAQMLAERSRRLAVDPYDLDYGGAGFKPGTGPAATDPAATVPGIPPIPKAVRASPTEIAAARGQLQTVPAAAAVASSAVAPKTVAADVPAAVVPTTAVPAATADLPAPSATAPVPAPAPTPIPTATPAATLTPLPSPAKTPSTDAGASRAQAARVQTPTTDNPVPVTDTSPLADINEADWGVTKRKLYA